MNTSDLPRGWEWGGGAVPPRNHCWCCVLANAHNFSLAADKHGCGDATRTLVGAWRVKILMQRGGGVPWSDSDHTAHLQPSPGALG